MVYKYGEPICIANDAELENAKTLQREPEKPIVTNIILHWEFTTDKTLFQTATAFRSISSQSIPTPMQKDN
jgi:hypothetical protein